MKKRIFSLMLVVLNSVPGFDEIYNNAKTKMKKDFKTYFAGNDQFKDFVGHGHWGRKVA